MIGNIFPFLRRRLLVLTLPIVALGMLGCPGHDDPEPTPNPTQTPVTQLPAPTPDPAPKFSVASQSVSLNDGSPGIQFFMIPEEDVVVVKIEVKRPLGDTYTFNFGSQTVVKGQSMSLPSNYEAFTKMSGTWQLVVTGSKAAGSRTSFVATQSVNVGA